MTITRRSLLVSSATGMTAAMLALPAVARKSTPASATPDAAKEDLEAAMLGTMDELGIPGALVLLESPETGVWTAALGMADLDAGTPMTLDTRMRIGSLTKTFTATMMLQLIDQGLLTLDTATTDLVPELSTLPNADRITVRHLLSMQSGLADYTASPAMAEASADVDRAYTPLEVVAFIDGEPALFEPGTDFVYSNTNYMILAMIAEELTGTPYHELVQSSILDDIGLTQTAVPITPDLPSPAARGYAWPMSDPSTSMATPVGSPVAAATPVDVTRINPWIPGAAGAMISTLGDLHTWMAAFRQGTLLSPESHEAQFDVSASPEADGARYGLGVLELGGAIGHTGGIDGFESIMLYVPALDTTAIVLVNALPGRIPASSTLALLQHVLPL